MSLRQLERYSKAVYRQTPLAWLRTLRFREAQALLARGETVKATAYTLGYRQISHFSREFKREVGVCPTDFVMESPESSTDRCTVAGALVTELPEARAVGADEATPLVR